MAIEHNLSGTAQNFIGLEQPIAAANGMVSLCRFCQRRQPSSSILDTG
jgi:hypothetical protein